MDIRFSDEVRRSPEWPLIEQASDYLSTAVGEKAAVTAKAEWTRVAGPEGVGPLYRLTLRDCGHEASIDIEPVELRDRLSRNLCVDRVWGDLLAKRSERQLEEIHALVGEMLAEGWAD